MNKLKAIHWIIDKALRRLGYEWNVLHRGDAQLGYWRIRLKSENSKSPKRLVILPGFGDSSATWQPFVTFTQRALKRKFDEIILVDFPGWNGFLAESPSFSSFDQLFSVTGDLLDALKPEIVIGHSLGGWILGNYAIECGEGKRPAPASRSYHGPKMIILVSPSGVFGNKVQEEEFRNRFLAATSEGIKPLRSHLFAKEPLLFRAMLKDFGAFFSKPDVIELVRSFGEHHRLESRVKSIQCKVWLVWGDRDTMTFSSWMNDWLALLPRDQAKGVWFLNSGHTPHVERPAAFSLLLERILSGKSLQELKLLDGRWWKSAEITQTG